MSLTDLARISTASHANDNVPRASAWWWLIPCFLFWCALIAWWAA